MAPLATPLATSLCYHVLEVRSVVEVVSGFGVYHPVTLVQVHEIVYFFVLCKAVIKKKNEVTSTLGSEPTAAGVESEGILLLNRCEYPNVTSLTNTLKSWIFFLFASFRVV